MAIGLKKDAVSSQDGDAYFAFIRIYNVIRDEPLSERKNDK